MKKYFWIVSILGFFFASVSFADEDFPKWKFGALIDARVVATGASESWLDGGFGKFRYGGNGDNGRTVARLSQVSLLFSGALNDSLSSHVQLNFDADPDPTGLRKRFDVIEAFVSYHPVLSSSIRLKTRGGIFFPPVSLENTGPGWTSPYTITDSAINTWIAEEVRITGAEGGIAFSRGLNELIVSGAAFGNNDPTGTLLAWRGWALHDRQTQFTEHIPLPPIPSIGPGGLFPRQPGYVDPFREVDGRVGYYAAADYKRHGVEINSIYFNNRGNPAYFDGQQYAWGTSFKDFGASVSLPANTEILAQYMDGHSKMGFGYMVKIDFESWYLLATSVFGRSRVSVRYDSFSVTDRDRFQIVDNNDEDGHAWTVAYILSIAEKHRFAAELSNNHSDRPFRLAAGIPEKLDDTQFQLSFRLVF